MKKAHLDSNSNLLGWYDTDIHDIIPTPNIEVTDDKWKEALAINANTLENGKFINKDKRTQEDKDKAKENKEWSDYQEAEKTTKKETWVLAGKPKYG